MTLVVIFKYHINFDILVWLSTNFLGNPHTCRKQGIQIYMPTSKNTSAMLTLTNHKSISKHETYE